MKILIISGLYYPHVVGGTEKLVQQLAEGLRDARHDVAVATLSPKRNYELAEINRIPVHYLPIKNIYFPGRPSHRKVPAKLLWHGLDTYNPFMIPALTRVLDAEQPDVINTHNIGGFSAATWQVVKRRKLPLVNTSHGLNLLCPWFMLRNGCTCDSHCKRCRLISWPRLRMSHRVDVFTSVSKFVIDAYRRSGAFQNATKMVIYNACQRVPGPISRYFAESRPLRFGFLGRLHFSKGIQLLLESFQRLPIGLAELVIGGTGTPAYERDLKQLANGCPGIAWLGFVKPEEVLDRIDVMVVPSLVNDSAPLVVLESMACGIPIIGAERGGIPELMGQDTGWTFDPNDPNALTEQLSNAIQSRQLLTEISKAAFARASQFSTEKMVQGYLEAYSCAIEKNRANA